MAPRIGLPRTDELRRLSPDWRLQIRDLFPLRPRGPRITDFDPVAGQPAERMVIRGSGFASTREGNDVTVGGKPAIVVDAQPGTLVALLSADTVTGPVEVTVDGRSAVGPVDYEVLSYPAPEEDGPPIMFAGAGSAAAGGLPPTGTARVLVVLVAPSDSVPANATTARQAVVEKWDTVHTFYDQASYDRLNLQVDVTTGWTTLTGTSADYLYEAGHASFPNVDQAAMDQLMAEAARAAQADGRNLDDYGMMAVVLNLAGGIRAWGGWSQQNFAATDFDGTAINITAGHSIALLAIGQSAHWGRFAHETAHNLVSVPASSGPGSATLGEDVYASDLVDPAAATAALFEMMGAHDSGPLFSAFHMKAMGWYSAPNIRTVQWDRNATSQEFDVVAHGLTEDATGNRVHIVEVRITGALSYFIEVRQRPGTTAQVFDPSIPISGAPNQGGVIVTKAISGTINNNQETRFITLLHDPQVLRQGEVATDPARDLRITVVNESVVARPLVCKVRVEWAQTQVDDPNGAFDLRVDPWDNAYQTPDIWVDRRPFGTFDQPLDSQGRPGGNGDRPRPREINQLFARIHNDGVADASAVRVTLYAITPPGVGDNGSWTPLQTTNIPAITAASHEDVAVNWVPVVGEHTCLKVYAERQLGEISGGNNSAQENVFSFEAPASSPPEPVAMPVAVRNPSPDKRLPVSVVVDRVPDGYTVHLDNSWVWLDPLGEKTLELWVIPTYDIAVYLRLAKKKDPSAPVRVTGLIARDYDISESSPGSGENVGSKLTSIGGITARVTPKRRGTIELREAKQSDGVVEAVGRVEPAVKGTRVDVVATGARGEVGWDTTLTDVNGVFRARLEAEDEAVKVQAFVVDAKQVSECASNIVYLGHVNGNGRVRLDPPLDR